MPRVQKINDIETVKRLYNEGKSMTDISKVFGVGFAAMQRYFKRNGIQARSLKEAKSISEKTCVGLQIWRKEKGSWNKGLTKSDPRVKANIEKGRATQIKNGKSKGKNNPMYGKTTNWKSGFRKDLGHFVRSSWEANFCRILIYLGIPYEYEKSTFHLSYGDSYTPDFYLPSKNKYYEIKGYNYNDKYCRFRTEYKAKLILLDEKHYARLIRIFSKKLRLEDEKSFFTREEILEKFSNFVFLKKPNVSKFCKECNISIKTVRRIFGSATALKTATM